MLDFDYCCKRPTPSVAGMIYPFGGDSVQKFYWGTSEILLPVYKVRRANTLFPAPHHGTRRCERRGARVAGHVERGGGASGRVLDD